MPRPSPAALAVASWIGLGLVLATPAAPARAGSCDGTAIGAALERADGLLDRGDGRAAALALEAALPAADPTNRSAILDRLRRAYELAVRQAEAAGRPREADGYRENLQILDRTTPTAPLPAAANPPMPLEPAPAPPLPDEPRPSRTTASPTPLEPLPARPIAAPVLAVDDAPSLSGPLRSPEPTGPTTPQALANLPAELPPAKAPEVPAEPIAPPAASQAPTPAGPDLNAADTAFRGRRFEEAGAIYAALARSGQLPAARRDHLAYCLCARVVARINAKPKSAAEWSAIQAEIAAIRQLSPQNWYGEYLRSLAAERSAHLANASKAPADPVVIRGSAPDEPATATQKRAAAAPAPALPQAQVGPQASANHWQILMTPSFRVLHADPELADRVAKAAEAARDDQTRRWTGQAPRGPWAPRCDIYLFPTADLFARMTGQPAESPGFSTMGMSGGRIVGRRVNLRADHPSLVDAVLPHEVTHVVLADLFPTRQIPRWADEGMAVLSEPDAEQDLRAADLTEPLASGRFFKVGDLLTMDYPENQYWALYYAQCVSLTRFLVEQGTPAQFVTFLQAAQRDDPEAQLRRIYKIDGYADLQRRWQDHATATPAVAAAVPAGDAPTVRR